ncbi:hypothetical protein GH714_043275 [Hevea brasiliensis]|uniref:Uncharacterized protein n=1 Tax=Hevea brasiliensis TaxID=3981 RepID=A0A6A6K438_HEVBR|nr:hypothetical protein GH714_043275 [Hevea brasiliensis]
MIYADEKPGIESIGGRSNLNDFPVYKSFEFIDNSKELKGFIQNNSIKLKTNRKKGHGVLRNRNGSDGFRSSDDSSNGTRYAMSSSSESEGSKGRKKVYLKRDLQDYDSPEMVAFLDDSSYDLFKDILTDKESLCQDEVLTENYELGHYNFSSILNSDSESSDSTKETLERLSCIANELKFIAEDDCKNERHNSKRQAECDRPLPSSTGHISSRPWLLHAWTIARLAISLRVSRSQLFTKLESGKQIL